MGDDPPKIIVKKTVTFTELDDYIQSTYNPPERNDSMICDILAMYLMGQKIIYTESKTYCEQRLHFLMLPAIFITSLCTILSLVLKDYGYGATIVSSLNGGNAFLLALISYLKLDGKAEAHRTSAYKLDKLHSEVVFQSGKILLMKATGDALSDMINRAETKVKEVKETNQFVIPETVRYNFPKTYAMNIFSEVKCIQNKEILCINELRDVINSIKEIESKKEPSSKDLEMKLLLEKSRKLLTDKFICIQTHYFGIDDDFDKELEAYRKRVQRGIQLCGWLKT